MKIKVSDILRYVLLAFLGGGLAGSRSSGCWPRRSANITGMNTSTLLPGGVGRSTATRICSSESDYGSTVPAVVLEYIYHRLLHLLSSPRPSCSWWHTPHPVCGSGAGGRHVDEHCRCHQPVSRAFWR